MLNDQDLLASMENNVKKIFKEVTLTFSNGWTLNWPYISKYEKRKVKVTFRHQKEVKIFFFTLFNIEIACFSVYF